MTISRIRPARAVLTAISLATIATIAQADPAGKWRIEFGDRVAKTVRDSLRVSLGDGYHVETDDGEDVVINKRGETPKFELTLASSTLTGLQVKINRE